MGYTRSHSRAHAVAVLCPRRGEERSSGATPFERARNWFSLRRLVAASAIAVVVIGIAIGTHHPVSQTPAVNDSDVVAKIDPQDYDVVADLDELIAWDENSVWEDKPTL